MAIGRSSKERAGGSAFFFRRPRLAVAGGWSSVFERSGAVYNITVQAAGDAKSKNQPAEGNAQKQTHNQGGYNGDEHDAVAALFHGLTICGKAILGKVFMDFGDTEDCAPEISEKAHQAKSKILMDSMRKELVQFGTSVIEIDEVSPSIHGFILKQLPGYQRGSASQDWNKNGTRRYNAK